MNKNSITLVLTILFCLACSKTEEQTQPPPQPLVPVVQTGEMFELTMYSIVVEHPELVFRDYSYGGVSTSFRGTQTNICETGQHHFKLVDIGDQPNLEGVRKELEKHGQVPCGQWIEAFRFRFPLSDGIGSVGVADPSWITSVWAGRGLSHPMLTNYYGHSRPWGPSWNWCNHWKPSGLRWLVQVD